jgi:hypothetical protein
MSKGLCVSAAIILGVVTFPHVTAATDSVGVQTYAVSVDEVSQAVLVYGQMIVHLGLDVQLSEVVRPVPLFSLQYYGDHHAKTPSDEPSYAEARAKCIAERLTHAWGLMDHGGTLELGIDDWNKYRSEAKSSPREHVAIYVRSSAPGSEPLRIMTVYPQDSTHYPWLNGARSLAEYLMDLMRVHYLLFWRNETDINEYEQLHIDRTREGKIFKEIAVRSLEMARLKNQTAFDASIVEDVLARIPLSQREQLCRLATTPPMDWESTGN